MIDIDTFEVILDEIANTLPPVFYENLNGGILLLPEVKIHPRAKNKDLYILGQYCTHPVLGRYIVIYYGSFERVHGHLELEALRREMEKTLKHEFRHHMEGQAGIRDLELLDQQELEDYEGRGQ
ncbi:MAG: metallopeptidase family protein [Eubacterium sp.]|nr:metallopeptidase family protein [Eubacterium sp.]